MEVKLYASRLGIEARVKSRKSLHKNIFVQHLSDSGYVRADTGNASLLVDAAPLGPNYLPGHGHADTLSLKCPFLALVYLSTREAYREKSALRPKRKRHGCSQHSRN